MDAGSAGNGGPPPIVDADDGGPMDVDDGGPVRVDAGDDVIIDDPTSQV